MATTSKTRASKPQAPEPYNLRDWYAGVALAGFMANATIYGDAAIIAKRCFEYADAMLKARG